MVDGEQVTWAHEPTLRALFETVVPADEWPGVWDGGVGRLLQEHHADFLSWSEAPLARAAMLAEHAASSVHGRRRSRHRHA